MWKATAGTKAFRRRILLWRVSLLCEKFRSFICVTSGDLYSTCSSVTVRFPGTQVFVREKYGMYPLCQGPFKAGNEKRNAMRHKFLPEMRKEAEAPSHVTLVHEAPAVVRHGSHPSNGRRAERSSSAVFLTGALSLSHYK